MLWESAASLRCVRRIRGKDEMFEKLKKYLFETKIELQKVTWPKVEELKESTRVVIIATFILTAFIGIIDQVLNRIVTLVFR
jgi:preprotein translocase subunit SecE